MIIRSVHGRGLKRKNSSKEYLYGQTTCLIDDSESMMHPLRYWSQGDESWVYSTEEMMKSWRMSAEEHIWIRVSLYRSGMLYKIYYYRSIQEKHVYMPVIYIENAYDSWGFWRLIYTEGYTRCWIHIFSEVWVISDILVIVVSLFCYEVLGKICLLMIE